MSNLSSSKHEAEIQLKAMKAQLYELVEMLIQQGVTTEKQVDGWARRKIKFINEMLDE